MKKAIELKNVCKEYDQFHLGPINLSIPSGIIVGLIGENGAGKTTLIKSMLGIIHPSGGSISIFEQDILKNDELIKQNIGVVLDHMFFPELMTGSDIDHVMKNVYKNWDSSLYQRYLDDFKLPPTKQIKSLSKGMRKKLEIATALAHHPTLLILDEPTSGLDPVVRNEILDIFLNFIQEEDHTILLSTHITSDLEHIADHIIFMNEGKIVLDQSRDDIIDQYGILKCDSEQFKILDQDDMIRYKKNKYSYDILIKDRHSLTKKYKDMIIDKITLEDLMVLYIKGVKK